MKGHKKGHTELVAGSTEVRSSYAAARCSVRAESVRREFLSRYQIGKLECDQNHRRARLWSPANCLRRAIAARLD
jgi:hypothetical protein